MNLYRSNILRTFLAGTIFWMALVLTPRAWVDEISTPESAEVPVRLLDQPDECLWCEPYQRLEPANCTDESSDEAPVWLNPDQMPEQQDSAPCLDRESEKPSA
jgi:hypothetical protein